MVIHYEEVYARPLPFNFKTMINFDFPFAKAITEPLHAVISCDVGYLCANIRFPRPLCSRRRPDVPDKQTSDVRRASSLNASALWWWGIIIFQTLLKTTDHLHRF